MVTRYGMDEKLGQAAYETERGNFLGQAAEGGGGASARKPPGNRRRGA